MAYECLYCGRKIEQDEVLFVDETPILYEDDIREKIFRRCGMVSGEGEAKFPRLYHRVNGQNVSRRDVNGFPFTIKVRPCDGLTAAELTQFSTASPVQEATKEPEKATESSGFGSESYEGFGSMENSPIASPAINAIVKPDSTESVTLSTRACPHCHCSLPRDFGLLPVYSIQILGGRASGKTAFLICLHQQLNRQLSANELGTADLLEESRLYLEPKVQNYERVGAPLPTPKIQKIFPLIYRITATFGKEKKEAFVSFHDVAGEGMSHGDYLFNLAGLSRSRNLLYIIDPNQLTDGGYHAAYNLILGGQGQAAPDANGNDQDVDFYKTDLILDITEVGAMVRSVLGDKKPSNIFVVMTKMDMPLMVEAGMFGNGKALMMYDIANIHKGMINGDALNQIDKEVNRFVSFKTHSSSERKLTESIAASFGCEEDRIHLCCISTHTRVKGTQSHPIMFANKYNSADPKHRIIEPFLCILYHIGLLPAKFKDQVDWRQNPEQAEQSEEKGGKKKKHKGLFGRAK